MIIMAGGKLWTTEEIELLRELSHEYTPYQIGKKLGRTAPQVVRMQCKQRIQGFCRGNAIYVSIGEVARLLHIDNHTVYKWNAQYPDFPAKSLRIVNVCQLFVVWDRVLGWLENHQELFDASRIEPYAFALEPQWLRDKRTEDSKKRLERKFHNWTEAEDARLRFLVMCGKSPKEIAYELHRPVSGIYQRKYHLGLTQKRHRKEG